MNCQEKEISVSYDFPATKSCSWALLLDQFYTINEPTITYHSSQTGCPAIVHCKDSFVDSLMQHFDLAKKDSDIFIVYDRLVPGTGQTGNLLPNITNWHRPTTPTSFGSSLSQDLIDQVRRVWTQCLDDNDNVGCLFEPSLESITQIDDLFDDLRTIFGIERAYYIDATCTYFMLNKNGKIMRLDETGLIVFPNLHVHLQNGVRFFEQDDDDELDESEQLIQDQVDRDFQTWRQAGMPIDKSILRWTLPSSTLVEQVETKEPAETVNQTILVTSCSTDHPANQKKNDQLVYSDSNDQQVVDRLAVHAQYIDKTYVWFECPHCFTDYHIVDDPDLEAKKCVPTPTAKHRVHRHFPILTDLQNDVLFKVPHCEQWRFPWQTHYEFEIHVTDDTIRGEPPIYWSTDLLKECY